MPRVIRQRQRSDCVVAAIANALGLSYSTVKEVCGSTRGGLALHEIEWLAGEFGQWRSISPRLGKPLRDWARKHPTGRYVVSLGTFLAAHAVAVVDGEILGECNESLDVCHYLVFVGNLLKKV